MFAFARPVQYEYLLRRVRTSNPNTSRTYLMGHYKVYDAYKYACQMCHGFYPNVDACQIEEHPKDELEPLHVLLCPNCTRVFQALRRDNRAYSSFIRYFHTITREEIECDSIVKVNFGDHEIWFTQTHIAEISELVKLRKSVEKENPNPTSAKINKPVQPTTPVQPPKPVSKQFPIPSPKTETRPRTIDYTRCKGRKIRHKIDGTGMVTDCDSTVIAISFFDGKRKGETVKYGISRCIELDVLELLQ